MGINTRELLVDESRENVRLLGLTTPSVALIAFVILIPTGALFWTSFLNQDGYTLEHYIRILDGELYWLVFKTTFQLSLYVTALCVLLGYPLAYFLSQLPPRIVPFCLALILLPFWTSVIVRTYAWLVLLQRTGLINRTLLDWGIIGEPLKLAFNFNATVIGMLHIMLPFLVLPLYASMKAVNPDYVRASISLGASPIRAFWTVFFPLTIPGLNAGALLVFVSCLGFYITPQVLGGGRVVTISMQVFDNATMYSDWGAASSLGLTMLAMVLGILYLGKLLSNAVMQGKKR